MQIFILISESFGILAYGYYRKKLITDPYQRIFISFKYFDNAF